MSYNDKTDRMNWKDEFIWLAISVVSGILLSFGLVFSGRLPAVNYGAVTVICCAGFYLLSMVVRIQNHRGKLLTGKTGVQEQYLKYVFPILVFAIGIALLLFI